MVEGKIKKEPAAKKIAVLGVLTALGLISFLIENLFPPLFIPGAKLGVANLFSLIALIIYSPWEAFAVVAARTVLGALFSWNFSSVLYSFTGGVVSMCVSSLLLYLAHPRISLVCVSVAAATAHSLTQCAVYALLTSTPYIMYIYAPYLMLIGAASGAFIGAAATIAVKKLPKDIIYFKDKTRGNI